MYIDTRLRDDVIKKNLRNSSDDREKCFLLLYQVFENSAFTNLLLDSSDDFVRAMFYGTVTYSHSIDFLIKHLSGENVERMDSVTRNILRMGVWQLAFSDKVPQHAAVYTSVELIKKYNSSASGYLNRILHKIIEKGPTALDLNQYRDEIKVSLKSEIYGILKKFYGKERAIAIGQAFLQKPKLSIRVNCLRTSVPELISELEAAGIKVSDTGFCDECLYLDMNDVGLTTLEAFKEGKFFVQNEAAMLASVILHPVHGSRILDCCSAPGGKATHLAELTSDNCYIDSVDIKKSRVDLIAENAMRLGISSVHPRLGNALDPDLGSRFGALYDAVMCDVPCSGLGLLGRKPDIRLTISYERIDELLPIQKRILDNASNMVKAGGVLIYSTCTLNKRENEMQVEEFLNTHQDFESESIEHYLPQKLLNSLDSERLSSEVRNGMITLTPDVDGTDGFFIARLIKRG